MRLILDLIIWLVWVPFRNFIIKLPFGIIYALLKGGSYFIYLIDTKRRNGVAEEIRKTFGERFNENEIKRIVRGGFYDIVRKGYENLLFGRIDEAYFDKIASIEGTSHVEAGLNKNKGVIVTSLHFGSFLLLAMGLGLKGYKLCNITGNPIWGGKGFINYIKKRVYELRKKEQENHPSQFLDIINFPKSYIEALGRNELVSLLVDGREGTKFIPLSFLDRAVQFSPGVISLAMRTGAAILPFAAIKGPGYRQKFVFFPPMELTFAEDKEEMLKINSEKLIRIWEKYVWEYPDRYAMTMYSAREETRLGLLPPLFID